jgi:hypothetical protein
MKNKKNPANCQLELADLLLTILRDLPELDKKPWQGKNRDVLLHNTMGWYKFLVANGRFASGKFTCDQAKNYQFTRVDKEEIKANVLGVVQAMLQQRNSDPDFGRRMISEQSVKFGLVDSSTKLDVVGVAKLAFEIGKCFVTEQAEECLGRYTPDSTRYTTDIRRFRRLVEAARQGVEELTTDSRLEWFRNNEIPVAGVRYYSVSGTMAPAASPLVNNRFGYNPGSPDDIGLLKNWADFTKVFVAGEYAGVNLNDSQVAIYKTGFWPGMIATLNLKNSGVKYTPLAVVGTHHWGMALPIVTEVRRALGGNGPLKRNPFPRTELMYSIALALANDFRVDAERGE